MTKTGVYIKCLYCGKEFYVMPCLKDVKKFCSSECRARHMEEYRDPARYLECLQCKKKFYVMPSRIKDGKDNFCSKECHIDFQRSGMLEVNCFPECLNCGKIFYANPAQIKNGRKFCSKDCVKLYKKSKKIEKVCEYCGMTFHIFPCLEKKGCGKFCSKKCYRDAHKKIELICKACGKIFYLHPRKAKNGGLYCSNVCRSKGVLGEDNPNWRGGLSFGKYCKLFNEKFKEDIRNRFDRKCFLCGKEKKGERNLAVHHIDYFKASICRGKDWAFVPLCTSCHSKTNGNRYFWFNLLINYWTDNQEIHLNREFVI